MNQTRSESTLAASAMTAVASKDVRRDYQAYELLHWGYTALPILVVLDKFTMVLGDWHRYLAPQLNFFGAHTTNDCFSIDLPALASNAGIVLRY